MVEEVGRDIRYVSRLFSRAPGFSSAAILTLALGIGATTTVFSIVSGVLLRPLPYPRSDALVRIVHSIGGINQPYFSDAIYLTYADNAQAFLDVGVWSPEATATVTGLGDPEEVRVLKASRSVLTTLGVQAALGRWFTADDDAPGSPDVVMLAHGYWQRRFGGDRNALARAITIDGRPHQIVGVMPAGFRFGGEHDAVLPLRINRAAPSPAFRLVGVARMKPGVGLPQASADVARILHIWFENAKVNPAVRTRWAPAPRLLKQDVVGDVGTALWILMAAIAVMLLMACANVANLTLVRADARRRELSVRAALGASRSRIARQLLTESLVLAFAGGALGVGLAYGGVRALTAIEPTSVPRLSEIAVDARALGFALAITMLSGVLFGLAPIVKHRKFSSPQALGAGGRGDGPTRERQRFQQALVAAQIALALVLLVAAGLMIRSLHTLRQIDPGFTTPEHLQTFTVSIPATLVREPEHVTAMQHELVNRIGSLPGVVSTAFTTRVPMGADRSSSALTIEGRPDDGRTPPNRQIKIVSPGVFQTLGTRLLAGRDFGWADLHERRNVAIVSEQLAREAWGHPEAAIGKRFREYYDRLSPWWEVVGVVGDVHDDGADLPAPATVYWPAHPRQRMFGLAGYQTRRVTVVVRTERAGTDGLLHQVRESISSVNAALPLAEVDTLDDVYRRSMARTSFTLVALAIAAGMALLLGISGVYGVIAYAVSQRRREIGIRLALGAEARHVRRLFVRRGLAVVAVGLAIGVGAAVAAARVMRSLLFGIEAVDPLTFAAMPLVLAVVAGLASYLPARRAMSVDPIETLKAE
jgi:predicted permease